MPTIVETFDEHWVEDLETGCWIWQRASMDAGYGCFKLNGKMKSAHVFAWEQANGPLPASLYVLHECDVCSCVNPAHLYAGTQAQNMRDVLARGQKAWCITPDQVKSIRTRLDRGELQRVVAKDYNISQAAVSHIACRYTWKWVK